MRRKHTPNHNGDRPADRRSGQAGRQLGDLGVDIVGGTPAGFSAYIKAEIPKWTAIVKASGAKLE